MFHDVCYIYQRQSYIPTHLGSSQVLFSFLLLEVIFC